MFKVTVKGSTDICDIKLIDAPNYKNSLLMSLKIKWDWI